MIKKRDIIIICIFIILLGFVFFVKAEQINNENVNLDTSEKEVLGMEKIKSNTENENQNIYEEKETFGEEQNKNEEDKQKSGQEEVDEEHKDIGEIDENKKEKDYQEKKSEGSSEKNNKESGNKDTQNQEKNQNNESEKKIDEKVLKDKNKNILSADNRTNNEGLINIDEINNSSEISNNTWRNINKTNNSIKDNSENSQKSTKKCPEFIENIQNSTNNKTNNETKENKQSNSKKTGSYVSLDNILSKNHGNKTKENKTEEQNKTYENEEYEKRTLYKDGKKQIEVEVLKNSDIEIEKQEKEEGLKKQIKISSEEHINKNLTVYTDLPKETKKENIRIYWKNEDAEITKAKKHEIKYYDENKNNLVDRISWIVPHLSEQIFEIIINFSANNESDKIMIDVLSPSPGEEVINPIEFKFNISYKGLENLLCLLPQGYKNDSLPVNKTGEVSYKFQEDFSNKEYEWVLYCWDKNNESINSSKYGYFYVNESYAFDIEKDFYIIGEDIQDSDIEMEVDSKEQCSAEIRLLDSQNNILFNKNIQSPYQNFKINTDNISSEGRYEIKALFNKPCAEKNISSFFSVASVAKAKLDLNKNNIETGEEVKITADIRSPIEKISSVILDYRDGKSNLSYATINQNNFNKDFYHVYDSSGEDTIKLLASINGEGFNIEDTSSPDINLIYPEEKTYPNNVTELNYTVSDTNLDPCWWTNNSGKTNHTINCGENITGLNAGDGTNTWIVYANDSMSNVGNDEITFNIDTISPKLTIHSPKNKNYSTSYIDFNISGNENLDYCKFSLDNWQTNYTMSKYNDTYFNYTNSSMVEGSFTVRFWCNDTAGNKNGTVQRDFGVDTLSPLIDYGNKTEPDYSNFSRDWIFVNVTVIEDNPSNITFNLFNQTRLVNSTTFFMKNQYSNNSINFTNLIPETYYYNVTIVDFVGNSNTTKTRTINIDSLSPDIEDTSSPDINLIYPEDGDIIGKKKIKFEYEAEDGVKIDNCTFKLYGVSKSYDGWSYDEEDLLWSYDEEDLLWSYDEEDLLWSKVHKDFDDKGKELTLDDFDEGDYYWEVECYDNSSNNNRKGYVFEVNFSDNGGNKDNGEGNENTVNLNSDEDENNTYERKGEVENLVDSINSFLEKEKTFDAEQKEALEDLDLGKKLNFYKKRLLQIDQDLKHNIKFITDQDLKQQRIKDMNEEIDEINGKVPTDLQVKESYSFVKNSVEGDLEEVIKNYMEAQNTEVSKRTIRKITQANLLLQQHISIKAEVRKVKMTYENKEKEITLIKKEINIKNNSHEKILEIIPKQIEENADNLVFLQDVEVIKQDPIIEINYNDLENGKLVYYVEKFVNLKDTEKIQTILFDEKLKSSGIGITGFFIFELGEESPLYYALFVILLIGLVYLSTFIFQKLKIGRWKKEPNVVRSFELVSSTNRAIKEKDLEKAREDYHKLKEIYPLLPQNCKNFFYKKINKLLLEIDKRDIFNLVREYEEARREKRKEDKLRIYEDIKKIYKRLPKKYREKVYERVIKREF